MPLVLADRVRETTTTTGTGTVTLAGAVSGFQSFAAVGDGNTTYYTISGQGNSEWEVGIGTYTASGTTLSRDTVLASSAGAPTKTTFSSGTKDVFVTYTAARSVNVDGVTVDTFGLGAVQGDILYASASDTFARLAKSATATRYLANTGATNNPQWDQINLANGVTGTLPIANGGTGETSRQAAMNALAGAVTSGQYLRGDGTDVVMSTIQAADVPTLNQNTTGNAGTVTNGLYTNAVQTNTANKSFQASNSGIATATGGLNTLEVIGTGGAAMMSFHRPGAFAAYFGIDSDNVWKVGGWSQGAAAYPLLYSTSSTAPGSAPIYGSRAWVNFNGTGTVAIRASGNVSSITDNGTGNYTVNFTTAMPDANYSVSGMAQRATSDDDVNVAINGPNAASTLAAGSVTVKTLNIGSNFVDVTVCCITIFR